MYSPRIFCIFVHMRKKEFNKQLKAGVHKVISLEEWENKGWLKVDAEGNRIIILYLIWHSWSNKGLVKLCNSLFFYLRSKRVYNSLPDLTNEYMTVYVDYLDEPNDYEKNGLVKMVLFNQDTGFKEV